MALSLAPTAALSVFPPACVCSYAGVSCPVTLLQHNIFIPSAKLKGKFNKVGGLGCRCRAAQRSQVFRHSMLDVLLA